MQLIATIPVTKTAPMDTITIKFTEPELQALGVLLDVAVKASGIQGAKMAVPLYDKLEAAAAAANKLEPQETE